jgi:hypothetical protein
MVAREGSPEALAASGDEGRDDVAFELPAVPLEIGVIWAGLEVVHELDPPALGYPPYPCPIDALAVGHYHGTTNLAGPERMLDIEISRAALGLAPGEALRGQDRLLTSLSRRGAISGHLGQSFLLPDPRSKDRVIALAGMGTPGRFGASELTVMARELCWTLGRLGKKHLAAPVIGSGDENMKYGDAVASWVRGLRLALATLEQDPRFQLRRVTFVTPDARQVDRLHRLLLRLREVDAARAKSRPRLDITVSPPTLEAVQNRAGVSLKEGIERGLRVPQVPHVGKPVPARLSVLRVGKRLRFGAVTEAASLPERDVQVDPVLVAEANARFAGFESRADQLGWGAYMGQLLLPSELSAEIPADAPLALVLDEDTAQIHWEMISQVGPSPSSELPGITLDRPAEGAPLAKDWLPLGIARGVSRQLRAVFAPPPDPPPPSRRLLRVVVIADPADDLPSARAEGEAVCKLFRSFNSVWGLDHYKVEVVPLIGSRLATRNDVLFHLTRRGPYDILHYAGHCAFDRDDPDASGWVFANKQRLGVHELSRIDRVPRFVFSNACESGALPDRPPAEAYALAPTFAEAFFARGVSNFVCTAWSVDDGAALDFALELYARLLGLVVKKSALGSVVAPDTEGGPRPMYVAMREARRKLLDAGRHGVLSWGAYQHYGDPYFQLFDAAHLRRDEPPGEADGE